MSAKLQLEDTEFGWWTVLSRGRAGYWLCRCRCGTKREVAHSSLRRGDSVSCGCYQKEFPNRRTHGQTETRTYRVWTHMLSRCYNVNEPAYARYGGRGIVVRHRWHDFANFLVDMGEAPFGTQIERLDNNGDYQLSNCIWATPKVQARNRRSTRYITICGERLSVAAACERFGVRQGHVGNRVSVKGETHIEAFLYVLEYNNIQEKSNG